VGIGRSQLLESAEREVLHVRTMALP